MSDEPLFIVVDGRYFLTSAGNKLSSRQLAAKLQALGLEVSHSTVARAREKPDRSFIPGYRKPGQPLRRSLPYGYVKLAWHEKLLSVDTLARKFGISGETARRAKKKGWFEILSTGSEFHTQITKERTQGAGQRLPLDLED